MERKVSLRFSRGWFFGDGLEFGEFAIRVWLEAWQIFLPSNFRSAERSLSWAQAIRLVGSRFLVVYWIGKDVERGLGLVRVLWRFFPSQQSSSG